MSKINKKNMLFNGGKAYLVSSQLVEAYHYGLIMLDTRTCKCGQKDDYGQ